jgi:hypothetical protein
MRPGTDQSATGHPPKRLLTVHEAASALGLTVEAVRSRLKRGSLPKEKDEDGTVYVVLEGVDDGVASDQSTDQARPGDDQSLDLSLLIARLEDEVVYLRQEAEDWKEEARRKDTIIMTMAQRIPELEPAQEASESPESAPEAGGSSPVPPEQEKRSWLARFFGL